MPITETTVRVTRERVERKHSKASLITLCEDCKEFFIELEEEFGAAIIPSSFQNIIQNDFTSCTKYQLSWLLISIYDDIYKIVESNNVSNKHKNKAYELLNRIAWGY